MWGGWFISRVITLEWIEDGEKVVGGDAEDPVGEEGKSPRQAQQATQAHDRRYAFALPLDFRCTFKSLETNEPGHDDDEGGEGEEEDQSVVADVDDVVDVEVCYPAPGDRTTRHFNHSSLLDEPHASP